MSADVLAEKLAALRDLVRSVEDDRHPSTADYLQALSMAAQTAESALRTAVGVARAEGASWEAVGRWVGVSRQAAQQRYGSGT